MCLVYFLLKQGKGLIVVVCSFLLMYEERVGKCIYNYGPCSFSYKEGVENTLHLHFLARPQ